MLFPNKLYWLLEHASSSTNNNSNRHDTTTNGSFYSAWSDIISWLPCGTAFKIYDPEAFTEFVLPQYFGGMNSFRSFRRQLNHYGIRKVSKRRPQEALQHADEDEEAGDNNASSTKPRRTITRDERQQREHLVGAYYHPLLQKGRQDLVLAMARPLLLRERTKKNPPLESRRRQSNEDDEQCNQEEEWTSTSSTEDIPHTSSRSGKDHQEQELSAALETTKTTNKINDLNWNFTAIESMLSVTQSQKTPEGADAKMSGGEATRPIMMGLDSFTRIEDSMNAAQSTSPSSATDLSFDDCRLGFPMPSKAAVGGDSGHFLVSSHNIAMPPLLRTSPPREDLNVFSGSSKKIPNHNVSSSSHKNHHHHNIDSSSLRLDQDRAFLVNQHHAAALKSSSNDGNKTNDLLFDPEDIRREIVKTFLLL